ncbi:MAG: NAD-binding protein [Acidobacteriota bacterium]
MLKTTRSRIVALLLALPVLLLIASTLYWLGMDRLEGDPRTYRDSLQWAVETFTTTGYGGDHHWQHPAMIALVTVIQFLGVFFVFLLIPIYLIPILEKRFEVRLPTAAPDLADHVIVYRYGPAVSGLLRRLGERKVPSLVIEEDEATARRLVDDGQRVVLSGIEDEDLKGAGLLRSRALIANADDHQDAALLLAARQLGFEGDILVLVEDPFHRRPLALAGATGIFTPRHLLGAALAGRASARINPRVTGIQRLGDALEVEEMRVAPDCELVGRTLRQADLGARTGGTVIGQWVRGGLEMSPQADTRLEAGGILVVIGESDNLRRMRALVGGSAVPRRGRFVVAGYGEVGKKVVELLHDAGEETTVIDLKASPGVDLVGDVLDQDILLRAELAEAQCLILAPESDSTALFGTVISREMAPKVPVIARVNESGNVERLYHAGADFALSMSQIAGQMLEQRLLGEEAVWIEPQLEIRRLSAVHLAGKNPVEFRLREKTGCTVVAVERASEVIVNLSPPFAFEADDFLYIFGDWQAVEKFSAG